MRTIAASASRSDSARAAHALDDAPDVHLDRGDVGVVGLGEDRARRCSDRRRAASVRSSGQPSVGDHDRRLPQPAGPARVAEPSPRGDDRARSRVGHRRRGGEPADEPGVDRGHARHLGLLEHHLGDEDRPAVARRAPRQIVPAVVSYQEATGHVADGRGRSPEPLSPWCGRPPGSGADDGALLASGPAFDEADRARPNPTSGRAARPRPWHASDRPRRDRHLRRVRSRPAA